MRDRRRDGRRLDRRKLSRPHDYRTPLSVEPTDNSCYGYVSVGGGGFMEWTAPNIVSTTATSTDWNALEDLTFWTEASGTVSGSTTNSKIGGGGQMYISGVFFLPNANPFVISGGSFQANGANAQFIVRRLSANGQGTLTMRPNPNDAVTIPPRAVELARPVAAGRTRSCLVSPRGDR